MEFGNNCAAIVWHAKVNSDHVLTSPHVPYTPPPKKEKTLQEQYMLKKMKSALDKLAQNKLTQFFKMDCK
jgi:glutamine amidotransferase-like uncharacterized protein